MAKKKGAASKQSAATAKAAKKAKAAQKVERKVEKTVKKSKGKGKGKGKEDDDDEDLEGVLEKMRREWEEAHTVTEELVEGPPSRRANATLTACPGGNHLWCIGGEFFSDDGKAYFYNDVFRYSPEKTQDEWRKFVSPTCPGPRSAHAVVATLASGGKIFLFGGEFSSLHQNTFHHYRDFWVFDISTHSWDRIETKTRPSARSGHRMAVFKHYIVLFGGFYDPGITTRYLNDLWVFDTQEYKWRQIELRETDPRPSPRSGFSFLPCPDGILLHGGYCKEYAKGKRPVGVMLDDTWFLNMSIATPAAVATSAKSKSTETLVVKWERRKRPSYAPPLRSGCTMTLWPPKSTGILFGGVTDEDRHEETLESVFWNDLYGYQIPGKGRWVSMALKRPKKKAAGGRKKKPVPAQVKKYDYDDGSDAEDDEERHVGEGEPEAAKMGKTRREQPEPEIEIDPDDPNLTAPLPRYNAMLAVLRNTLYIYGGIYEKGSREYTLDDFYSLQLDKLDRYICLKQTDVVIAEGDESSSDEDDDDDDDDDDDEDDEDDEEEEDRGEYEDEEETIVDVEEEEEPEKSDIIEVPEAPDVEDLRTKATAFMGVAKDATRSPEDIISTPLPGETLAMFYARSRASICDAPTLTLNVMRTGEHWSQKAHSQGAGDNRGKQLRRNGFALAEERYATYKPILEEVEKILAEAGLDEEEMRRGAAAGPISPAAGGQSRNRR
ncbi:hypothetical protein H0H81_000243 [Sphagnurus paluster]|uniref:DUF4110 domain-containing protein n=1 Tax=Sphagnurus paluster TaxID=117069 RepID=A0A9P7KKS5_9AGAR|nr:hypothetical protein H0H81_000243 [Sphagnurus paluster]